MDIPEEVFYQDKYRRATERHGDSPKSLMWTDYHSVAARLRQLVVDLEISGKTVLDAGCGLGYLIPYLYTRGRDFKYLGVDTNPEIIRLARQRYNDFEFQVANPFADDFKQKFDIVLCSGVMNGNARGWLPARKQMISKLYNLADEAAGFNMAGGYAPPPDNDLIAYADAREIVKHCLSLTPRIVVRAHYLYSDFTVLIFK